MKIKTTLRCVLILIAFLFSTQVFATEKVPFNNLGNSKWISFSSDNNEWVNKCSKKNVCYKRTIIYNDFHGSVYYKKNKEIAFATGCQYEFIKNGKLIGYSNSDLNFYKFSFDENSEIKKEQLSFEEVSALFDDYRIIKISDFSKSTNSLKIKKGHGTLKLIIYNDVNSNFDFYEFGSNNAKIEKYPLKGFLKVKKAGMIHFSHYSDNTKDNPLYVILVR